MKISFSTLACADWTFSRILDLAVKSKFDGIELRFVENQDSMYKLPAFSGAGLAETKRRLGDSGMKISCVDTSCAFQMADAKIRAGWVDEGRRMGELAAALGAPGIRIFESHPDAPTTVDDARKWTIEGIQGIAARIASLNVGAWLETHGDFATAAKTLSIVNAVDAPNKGVIWDAANCFSGFGERPSHAAPILDGSIRHVHFKDLTKDASGAWIPELTGQGVFPLLEVVHALGGLRYGGFVSFEWEKKWHPSIPPAEVAVPQFAEWWRANSG